MMEQQEKQQIRKMKAKIYHDCMAKPNVLCIGDKCPLYNFYDTCHKQFRRGEFK